LITFSGLLSHHRCERACRLQSAGRRRGATDAARQRDAASARQRWASAGAAVTRTATAAVPSPPAISMR
jgi:hypothetical protein